MGCCEGAQTAVKRRGDVQPLVVTLWAADERVPTGLSKMQWFSSNSLCKHTRRQLSAEQLSKARWATPIGPPVRRE